MVYGRCNDIDQIDLFFDSIQFDCRRMEDGHLIETFYITKPQLRQQMPQDPGQLSESLKKSDESASGNTDDSNHCMKGQEKQKKMILRDKHIQRSYRMISKQVNCSAAVSVSQKSRCTTSKKQPQQNNCQFMEQFEHFFRSFVPSQRKKEQLPQRRRSSRQRSRRVIPQAQSELLFESQSDGSGSEDETRVEFVRSQKQAHLTFYQKMRDKIDQRIQPLLEKPAKPKLHRVETKPKSKKTVQAILKEKTNLRDNESHLRLSRAGLVIKLSQMQAKAAEGKLSMIETQKAKKDMIFQRCLIKNCEIVLENIQNYQQQRENPTKNKQKKQQHRRYNSNILHKTYASQQKMHKDAFASVQDISLLKLREKCLQIQLKCKKNYNNNKQLKQGLRAFGKFCNRMQKRLQAGEDDIQANLRQNLQRDDEAQRLYDAMANIAPIQCYLRSLE